MATKEPPLTVYGVRSYEHQGAPRADWTPIGVAFKNRDGSLALKLDYIPTGDARILVRERAEKAEEGEE